MKDVFTNSLVVLKQIKTLDQWSEPKQTNYLMQDGIIESLQGKYPQKPMFKLKIKGLTNWTNVLLENDLIIR